MSRVNVKEAFEKLNKKELETIRGIHGMLDDIKINPERYENPVQLIEDLEYALQGLWKFPRDSRFHLHWLEIKACSCGRLDNLDRLGYGRVINGGCPWHGTKKDAINNE
jgi:hypothetical protein